jgi:hypothetical protein
MDDKNYEMAKIRVMITNSKMADKNVSHFTIAIFG